MHILTTEQTQAIAGGDLSNLVGTVLGVGGAYYGLCLGAALTTLPAAIVGNMLVFYFEMPTLGVCSGIMTVALGAIGGAIIGGKFGSYVGTEIVDIAQINAVAA